MELLKLTPREFKQITQLIYDRTGIYLPDSKLSLLSNRLRRRLRTLKLDTFKQYYELLCDEERCQDELPHFLSAVTTNETYFFRNEKLWHYFQDTWIPEMVEHNKGKTRKEIRIWSAASSSGAEAYTAAICLREKLPQFSTWTVQIIGSDISQRMLDEARAAKFNDYAVSKVAPALLSKWFDKEGDLYVLKPKLRKMVRFVFHNLRDAYPNGRFDLIFLRNVLMYFDTPMKCKVLETVTNALRPGGRLVVGDVDPIRNTAALRDALRLDYCGPNLYQKPDRATITT